MTEEEINFNFGKLVGLFEAKGSYCKTGANSSCFALEMFATRKDLVEAIQQIAGGHVIKPPPAAPTRWTWRLYGTEAEDIYERMRPFLSANLVERGDRKLSETKTAKEKPLHH